MGNIKKINFVALIKTKFYSLWDGGRRVGKYEKRKKYFSSRFLAPQFCPRPSPPPRRNFFSLSIFYLCEERFSSRSLLFFVSIRLSISFSFSYSSFLICRPSSMKRLQILKWFWSLWKAENYFSWIYSLVSVRPFISFHFVTQI